VSVLVLCLEYRQVRQDFVYIKIHCIATSFYDMLIKHT